MTIKLEKMFEPLKSYSILELEMMVDSICSFALHQSEIDVANVIRNYIEYRKRTRMAKYRKKPIIVDAVQWLGWELSGTPEGTMYRGHFEHPDHTDWLEMHTLEGTMEAHIGDWIITGVDGEVYPCKDSIFRKTYEKVEDE